MTPFSKSTEPSARRPDSAKISATRGRPERRDGTGQMFWTLLVATAVALAALHRAGLNHRTESAPSVAAGVRWDSTSKWERVPAAAQSQPQLEALPEPVNPGLAEAR